LIRSVNDIDWNCHSCSIHSLLRYAQLGNEGLKWRNPMPKIAGREKAVDVETIVN